MLSPFLILVSGGLVGSAITGGLVISITVHMTEKSLSTYICVFKHKLKIICEYILNVLFHHYIPSQSP